MFDSAMQQIGVVSAFRDITAHMHAEAHIQRALETMLHVAEAVSGITDIHDILRRVLQLTLSTLNCERGVVYMHDAEQQRFAPLLSVGFLPEGEQQWLNEQSQWLADDGTEFQELKEQLMQGHATLVHAEQFRNRAEQLPNPFRRTMILAAPITHSDRLLGLMLLDRPPAFKGQEDDQESEFTMWDMAIVEGISQLAGLAIKQARLQEEATNARANEAAMREANALKDDFLSITAHEFRTPLTIILAHSQLLLRSLRRTGELGKKDSMGDSLSTIEEQAHLLTNIVNTFLEVTQINRGQLELKIEQVDLAEIAMQVVTNYSATSPDHQVSCEIEPCAYDYMVMGDSARLFQVFVNLVQNAIKYSPLGGPVTVRLCQRITSGYIEKSAAEVKAAMGKNAGEIQVPTNALQARRSIEVSVEDRGMGIPKDAQVRLFERFYRAPNTQGSKVKGIGLGLYLVAELLRMHGGTIRVESSGIPGEGSRFTFALPALERDDTTGE
jgi:signal transduction histidine kinase